MVEKYHVVVRFALVFLLLGGEIHSGHYKYLEDVFVAVVYEKTLMYRMYTSDSDGYCGNEDSNRCNCYIDKLFSKWCLF